MLVQTKHRERQLLQSELNIAQNALRTIFLHIARWLYDFCMEIELPAWYTRVLFPRFIHHVHGAVNVCNISY